MSSREDELLTRLESLTAGLQAEVEQSERELSESREQQAAEARTGALGPDWQRVQSRIDAGDTTLMDVFSGADETPEARRIVETAQGNLAALAEDLPPEVEEERAIAQAEVAEREAAAAAAAAPPVVIVAPDDPIYDTGPVDPVDPVDPTGPDAPGAP